MSVSGCSDVTCLRAKSSRDLRTIAAHATDAVKHEIKPILEANGMGPVVDGVSLRRQLQEAVSHGLIRPHTPISWNYAENDAFTFVAGAWENFYKAGFEILGS